MVVVLVVGYYWCCLCRGGAGGGDSHCMGGSCRSAIDKYMLCGEDGVLVVGVGVVYGGGARQDRSHKNHK